MKIFKDKNDYNEKSIVGAIAFVIMCLVMILETFFSISAS